MSVDTPRADACRTLLATVALGAAALGAQAAPITISNAGYWLETVGTNTIGLAGGGSPSGISTTLFVANTTPLAGTTASASLPSGPTGAPITDSTGLWARRVLNPGPLQLAPLTVVFSNGADQASFVGRDLSGLTAMPLVSNLLVSAGADPLRPTVSWTLPSTASAGEIDFVQIVFYDDDTNLEVGTRVTRPAGTTSFQFGTSLPVGFNLVVNVRLIDLFNNGAAFTSDNIQRESRAYVNYTARVPEPAMPALLTGSIALLAWRLRRRSA